MRIMYKCVACVSTLYGWHVHTWLRCGKMLKRNAFRQKPFVVQPLCLGIFNMQRCFLQLKVCYWVHKVQIFCHKYLFGYFACTLHFLMFMNWFSELSGVQVAVTFEYTPVCTNVCLIAQALACTPKWCSIYGCARAAWVHRAVEFSVAPKVFSTSLCCNSWQCPGKSMSVSADKCYILCSQCRQVQAQCRYSVR